MPNAFAPKKSGAHRLACCSLYKALLQTCARFKTPAHSGAADHSQSFNLASGLKELVRFRYKQDKELQNPRQIRDALEYGTQSLQTLHSASHGSKSALHEMMKTLSCAHDLATLTSIARKHYEKDMGKYAPHVLKKKEYIRIVSDPATYASPKPGSIPILSRPVPLSQIKSAKRRAPRLVVTHGIPFLRYHRKQSRALSLYLLGAIRQKERRIVFFREIDPMIQLALDEDKWDDLIVREHGIPDYDATTHPSHDEARDARFTSWAKEFSDTKTMAMRRDIADGHKYMKRGEELYNIMVAERQLALKEKREAKQNKKRGKHGGDGRQSE